MLTVVKQNNEKEQFQQKQIDKILNQHNAKFKTFANGCGKLLQPFIKLKTPWR